MQGEELAPASMSAHHTHCLHLSRCIVVILLLLLVVVVVVLLLLLLVYPSHPLLPEPLSLHLLHSFTSYFTKRISNSIVPLTHLFRWVQMFTGGEILQNTDLIKFYICLHL